MPRPWRAKTLSGNSNEEPVPVVALKELKAMDLIDPYVLCFATANCSKSVREKNKRAFLNYTTGRKEKEFTWGSFARNLPN